MTPEGEIKKGILDWLNSQPGCFAQSIQVGKIPGRRNLTRGVSDILVTWNGLAVAIEVKTAKTDLEDDQETFITNWTRRGQGIGIVARSLEDVMRVLFSSRIRSMAAALAQSKTHGEILDYGRDRPLEIR